ncbi:MAG: site-2 protease family protein [Thermosynechococcaceae cyanobacterium MS004]|nr:site-2 protease family protein [Thermosynechococcaceae cyanobacterium MS004]
MTDITTELLLLATIGFLGWGFYRARPMGKLGILAWSQSAVLMSPWLVLFGLMGLGIAVNLVSILFLLVGSVVLYIYLGKRLRALASQNPAPKSKFTAPPLDANGPASPLGSETSQAIASPESPQSTTPESAPEVPPIPAEELKRMQGLFGIDTFFATETIPYQDGVIFKGNLRGEPEEVWAQLTQKLEDVLGDRYRLFLVQNPDERPVVIILPSSNGPKPSTASQRILAVVLMVATLLSCCTTAGLLLQFDLFSHLERWVETLPMGLGLFSVLLVHEVGHQVMAKRHNVKFSWPFFLPALQIGSFGALNRFESHFPNRKVLFDVAFAGPAAGGLFSLAILIVGLVVSSANSLFKIPALFFQGSILVGTLARVVLGDALHQDLVSISPLVVVGWVGLVISAINLMPAGQLDGGRIVQAVYGRKVAGRTTFVTLIFLGIASLVNPLALYWAAIILILQRDLERPSLNELTEPNDARAALALVALFLMVAVLIPLTPSLAGRLGIGL